MGWFKGGGLQRHVGSVLGSRFGIACALKNTGVFVLGSMSIKHGEAGVLWIQSSMIWQMLRVVDWGPPRDDRCMHSLSIPQIVPKKDYIFSSHPTPDGRQFLIQLKMKGNLLSNSR